MDGTTQKSRDDNVASGCDQCVWSMAVSIGGRFTGKPHNEVSLFLLSVSFFSASFYFLFLFCDKDFSFLFRYFFVIHVIIFS